MGSSPVDACGGAGVWRILRESSEFRELARQNVGEIGELDRAGFMRGVEEKDGGRLEATMPIADWTADV